MRLLVTGSNGQVGRELVRTLAPLGEVVASDRAGADLARPDELVAAVRAARPAIIVNAAAYTAVDRAESEPEVARAVNAVAPGILAEEAKRLGALLVHYSTDYVFDGSKPAPYTEDDAPRPLNVYGRTKLEGEQAIRAADGRHLILRTSWVYGPRGSNFLLTMLRLGKEREELRVVDDQLGAPTSSAAIAEATARILGSAEASGLFHLTASGRTSWHGFAAAIMREAGLSTRVVPIRSSEYPMAAKRPLNSVLSNDRLAATFGFRPSSWEDQLAACMRHMRA